MTEKYNNISVFKNTKRTTDKHPLFNVIIEMADGTKWEGGLWEKTAKSGVKYLNGLLKPPFDAQRKPTPRPRGGSFGDMDDDIPFETNDKPKQERMVDW